MEDGISADIQETEDYRKAEKDEVEAMGRAFIGNMKRSREISKGGNVVQSRDPKGVGPQEKGPRYTQ